MRFGIRTPITMARAIFLRPEQRFLKTAAEREEFTLGYCELEAYSKKAFCHFYSMGNPDCQKDVRGIIESAIFYTC